MKVEKLTEKAFTEMVIELARLFGWRVSHFGAARTATGWRTPCRGDAKGFPDLVLAHPGRGLIFAELKVGRGKLAPEQQAWLDDLRAANVMAYCWRPEDFEDIEALLRGELFMPFKGEAINERRKATSRCGKDRGAEVALDGGKTYLAKEIIARMPSHLTYVEPYFGGGAVLFERDISRDWMATDGERLPSHLRGCNEIVNDINRDLTNFWSILQNEKTFSAFRRIVQAMPPSEAEWNAAGEPIDPESDYEGYGGPTVVAAVRFFVRCRQSMSGRMASFTPLATTRTRSRMNELPSAWWNAIDGLPAVHDRLRRVVILDAQPALDVIDKYDGPQTLFYLDPPYMLQTRTAKAVYAHEMSAADHEALLVRLSAMAPGKFMLSGYRSTLYDCYAERSKWTRHDFAIDNKAAKGDCKRKMVECLWCNF